MKKGNVYFMVGNSGCGKTWRGKVIALQHLQDTGRECVIINKDDIREDLGAILGIPLNKFVEDAKLRRISNRLFRYQIHLATKEGKDVVIDAIHNTKDARHFSLSAIANRDAYTIYAIATEGDIELLRSNVRNRHAYLKSIGRNSAEHPTSDEILLQQKNEYTRPTKDEGFDEIIVHKAQKYEPVTLKAVREPVSSLPNYLISFFTKLFTLNRTAVEVPGIMPLLGFSNNLAIDPAHLAAYTTTASRLTFLKSDSKGGIRRRYIAAQASSEEKQEPNRIKDGTTADIAVLFFAKLYSQALEGYSQRFGTDALEKDKYGNVLFSRKNIKIITNAISPKTYEAETVSVEPILLLPESTSKVDEVEKPNTKFAQQQQQAQSPQQQQQQQQQQNQRFVNRMREYLREGPDLESIRLIPRTRIPRSSESVLLTPANLTAHRIQEQGDQTGWTRKVVDKRLRHRETITHKVRGSC